MKSIGVLSLFGVLGAVVLYAAAPTGIDIRRGGGSGGGGATPAGSTGAIQFNEGGALAGTNDLVFWRDTNTVVFGGVGGIEMQGYNAATTENYIKTRSSYLKVGVLGIPFWQFHDGGDSTIGLRGDLIPLTTTNSIGSPWGAPGSTIGKISALTYEGSVYSNSVYSLPGASSVVTLYGTNQFWRVNITSNITFADNNLRTNVVYWIKTTNNTSTVSYPGSWRWLDGPTLSTAPSLQTGEYILRVQKFDNATNAWIETGPTYTIATGPGLALTTNSGVITINQAGFQTLAYSSFTNCIFDMSLGYNATVTLTNNIHFDQPTNLRAGADFKIYVAQDSVGTRNWWFNTNYWQFNVFPFLPVETNATRISILSGFVNPAGTKLVVMQATDFRP